MSTLTRVVIVSVLFTVLMAAVGVLTQWCLLPLLPEGWRSPIISIVAAIGATIAVLEGISQFTGYTVRDLFGGQQRTHRASGIDSSHPSDTPGELSGQQDEGQNLPNPHANVLLVTATSRETQAVLTLAKSKFRREPRLQHFDRNTYLGLDEIGGAQTWLVQCEMGSGGTSGSILTISEGIRDIAPSAVIMVGLAFGVDPQDQQIGDVLVSRQIQLYELQRVGTTAKGTISIIPRGDRTTVSSPMLQRFRAGEATWSGAKVHFGLILSGEKLVDNIDFRDQLRQCAPDAIGGEMEGAGLYAAASDRKVDWILVKGICDWADGHKPDNEKENQTKAAGNAAAFVINVLEQGGFARGNLSVPKLRSPVASIPTGQDFGELPSYMEVFTKDTITKIDACRSVFLRVSTYGTVDTQYEMVDKELLRAIADKISTERFFLVWGSSGRGKSFFCFQLMESVLRQVDAVIYYSPQRSGTEERSVDSLLFPIRRILSSGRRVLLVVDDAHLLDSQFKGKLLLELHPPENVNLHFLFVSRQKEEDAIPLTYLRDDLMQNFNKVAERTFEGILHKFSKDHGLYLSREIEQQIKDAVQGSNLVFLTLVLHSWASLLRSEGGRTSLFQEILRRAYADFLAYYDSSKPENWKYVNHVVSALFQFEIRIDKRYLLPEQNPNLAAYNLQAYLHDRLVHRKVVVEEERNRIYYVFMDFARGEEPDMMKHAAEFRFYLDANAGRLCFRNRVNLDRLEFTKLVLQDYVLFEPVNIPEVLDQIRRNAGSDEDEILRSLYNNASVKAVISRSRRSLLQQE